MKLACVCCFVIAAATTVRAQTPDAGIETAPPPPASSGSSTGSAAAPPPPAPATEPAPDGQPAPSEDKDKDKDKDKHDDREATGFSSEQGDIAGDDKAGVGARDIHFRFLFQTRYQKTFVRPIDPTMTLDPRLGDGYALNRIFLRATTRPKPWLSAKLLVDFAELSHKTPKHALKLAYTELELHKRAILTVGLFKRTYSLLELLPIAEFELADAGPTDTLIKDAELAGRDPGAMIRIDPLPKKKWLNVYLGIFDGGLGGLDARPLGLATGRLVSKPFKHLRIGIDGAWRNRGRTPLTPGLPVATGPGRGIGADATWLHKHYQIRGEWLWGTRADEINAGDAKTFMAAWLIAAAKIPVDRFLVMPAVRFEWLDADREHSIGRRYYVTGALNLADLGGMFRVVVDVSRSQVQRGSFPLSVAPVLHDVSSTICVVQLQVQI